MLRILCCCSSASSSSSSASPSTVKEPENKKPEKTDLNGNIHIAPPVTNQVSTGIVNRSFLLNDHLPHKGLKNKLIRRKISPFQDPDVVNCIAENGILAHVFKYLKVNDLLSCRRTNKLWNGEASKVLRSKIEGVVILQRGLAYYAKLMGKSLDIPVGRVFLKLFDMNEPDVQNFFEVVGHSVVVLVLNLEGLNLPSFLKKIHCLSNLKELSLNLFQHLEETEQTRQESTVELKRKGPEIKIVVEDTSVDFSTLSSLESIVFSCETDWKSDDPSSLEKLITLAPNLRNLNLLKWPFRLRGNLFQNSSLEHLKFLALRIVDDQAMYTLGSKQMKFLKTIEFEFAYDVTEKCFLDFLKSVGGSLEYLEIKNEAADTLPFSIPSMMKELHTIRLTSWTGVVSMDSILLNAPRLDKLQLCVLNLECIEVKDLRPSDQLQYLALSYENNSHSVKSTLKTVKNFVQMFPNVKLLMMKRITDKTLEIIIQGWPKLEMLRITTSFGFSDSGMTGISLLELQNAAKSENKLECGCLLPEQGKLDDNREVPRIGNLKYLKDLRIETEPGTKLSITNLSFHLGIRDLTELITLRITCQELGPHWCLRCIADNLPNLRDLMIMDRAISNDRYSEQELHYLLRKVNKLRLTFAPAKSTFSGTKTLPIPQINE